VTVRKQKETLQMLNGLLLYKSVTNRCFIVVIQLSTKKMTGSQELPNNKPETRNAFLLTFAGLKIRYEYSC